MECKDVELIEVEGTVVVSEAEGVGGKDGEMLISEY
jgi:hypothetical protein